MADTFEQLLELDAEVLVVGPGSGGEAAALLRRLNPPFPVLADPEAALYRSLGLGRVMLGLVREHGTLLVDRAGQVRYRSTGANPGRAYDEQALLQALRTLSPR